MNQLSTGYIFSPDRSRLYDQSSIVLVLLIVCATVSYVYFKYMDFGIKLGNLEKISDLS